MLTVLPLVKARSSGIEGATLDRGESYRMGLGPTISQVGQSSQGVCTVDSHKWTGMVGNNIDDG